MCDKAQKLHDVDMILDNTRKVLQKLVHQLIQQLMGDALNDELKDLNIQLKRARGYYYQQRRHDEQDKQLA